MCLNTQLHQQAGSRASSPNVREMGVNNAKVPKVKMYFIAMFDDTAYLAFALVMTARLVLQHDLVTSYGNH